MRTKLKKPGSGSRRRKGLTITEVVVASSLLIVAMVPILRALTVVHMGSVMIERKTMSLNLAKAKLDEIRARSIYNYADSFTLVNASLDGTYLCNVTDQSQGADLRKVVVEVGFDHDEDNVLDADETEVDLATNIARRW